MKDHFAVLEATMEWITRQRESLISHGLTLDVDPPDQGRSKTGISLAVDSSDRLSQFIVWDTGEAQLQLADVPSGEIHVEHREITSDRDLEDVLKTLLSWVSQR
ncbi:hypothetical protein ACIRQP_41575 [Streptomyces sp. NPDC102274]|uniref:immunity protein TriTu family protein n=1 Tax=Streptomyces sp. NPDC102274 TaxID=3366151 RepID=UPI00382642E5